MRWDCNDKAQETNLHHHSGSNGRLHSWKLIPGNGEQWWIEGFKKKKAKQLAQKKQLELENKLIKLSQEEIEVLSRMIKQIVSDISKAFSKMFDSLFNYLENSEVKFEEIERRRP